MREANLAATERGLETVLRATKSGAETTKLVTEVSQTPAIAMTNLPQYYLFNSIIKAYLSCPVHQGQTEFTLEESRFLGQEA
jgi:hypothetical protein